MRIPAYICTWRTQRSSLALLLCACFILCVWNLGWMQGHQHAPFQSHGATGLYNRARQDMTTTAKLPSADSKENSSFTAIKNSEVFVRAVFLDKRVKPRTITVLALAPLKRSRIYARGTYKDGSHSWISESRTDVLRDMVPPFCRFQSMMIHFETNKDPHEIQLSTKKKGKHPSFKPKVVSNPSAYEKTLGMCLPTIFGMTDKYALRVVQFMELNQMLGVTQAILYDITESGRNVSNILGYYQDQGFLRVVPWVLPVPSLNKTGHQNLPPGTDPFHWDSPNHPYCARRDAQRLMHMHCNLDNVGRFKYIALQDFDEVIIPRQHKTLTELLEHMTKVSDFNKTASLTIKEAYFCVNNRNASGKYYKFFSHVRKPINPSLQHLDAAKTIIRPERTALLSIHRAKVPVKGFKIRTVAPVELATMNHFRVHSECENEPGVVTDHVMDKYAEELDLRVRRVFDKLGLLM